MKMIENSERFCYTLLYMFLNVEGYPSIMVCDHIMIINLFSAPLSQGRAPDLWDCRFHKIWGPVLSKSDFHEVGNQYEETERNEKNIQYAALLVHDGKLLACCGPCCRDGLYLHHSLHRGQHRHRLPGVWCGGRRFGKLHPA